MSVVPSVVLIPTSVKRSREPVYPSSKGRVPARPFSIEGGRYVSEVKGVRSRAMVWLGRAGTAAILAAILGVAVYGLTHVSVRPINPAQKAPKGHFAMQCSLCHTVDALTKLVRE